MIPTPYACRICRTEHVAQADDCCPSEWITGLATILVCDRCCDYRVGRRKYGEMIARACGEIRAAALTPKGVPAEMRQSMEALLRNLTQSYARIVCRYHGLGDMWDEDFVNQLIDYPDRAWTILRAYEDQVRDERKKPSAELPNYSNDP